jgi:antitoxin component YwqK of YwqJK toxin-antitoxin module
MLTQERLVEIHVLETQEGWAKYYYESGAIKSEENCMALLKQLMICL